MALHLVTGGSGFIGSHLTARLVERGEKVRVLDNLSTGSPENLKEIRNQVEFHEGDIRDPETVERGVEGADCVFHLAALPSVQRSVQFPLEAEAVNARGTLQVLEAARSAGVRRVIYASSSSVYGDSAVLPKREDLPPNPLSPYAVGKLCGEQYCRVYCELHGLETVSLRYFNVFGPRQDPASPYAAVIPRFIFALLSGRRPVVYGDGEQTRDFTFVSNAVDANILASTAEGAPGRVFNLACSVRTSVNALLDLLRQIIGTSAEADYEPPQPGDVRDSQADISQAREFLGFEPAVDLEEGLRKTAQWFQKNAGVLPKELNRTA
ncbi:MAG: SDR family oxidoreductase [Nitrospinota bacterium]